MMLSRSTIVFPGCDRFFCQTFRFNCWGHLQRRCFFGLVTLILSVALPLYFRQFFCDSVFLSASICNQFIFISSLTVPLCMPNILFLYRPLQYLSSRFTSVFWIRLQLRGSLAQRWRPRYLETTDPPEKRVLFALRITPVCGRRD